MSLGSYISKWKLEKSNQELPVVCVCACVCSRACVYVGKSVSLFLQAILTQRSRSELSLQAGLASKFSMAPTRHAAFVKLF